LVIIVVLAVIAIGAVGARMTGPKPQPHAPLVGETINDEPIAEICPDGDVRSRKRKTERPEMDRGSDHNLSSTFAWLTDIPEGRLICSDRFVSEFGIAPSLGWHTDKSLIVAVFARPQQLRPRQEHHRLYFEKEPDYVPVQLAAISKQAVPVFTADGNEWQFEGFFTFQRPATNSVKCERVSSWSHLPI